VEPAWPEADVIVGNPPFLGDKKMRAELGDEYVERVRKLCILKSSVGSEAIQERACATRRGEQR